MVLTAEDEIIRRLKKTSFDVVYKAMEDYSASRGSGLTNVPVVEKILEDHGWTFDEFLDGLLQKLKTVDLNL